jgi:hypothetical protein
VVHSPDTFVMCLMTKQIIPFIRYLTKYSVSGSTNNSRDFRNWSP